MTSFLWLLVMTAGRALMLGWCRRARSRPASKSRVVFRFARPRRQSWLLLERPGQRVEA